MTFALLGLLACSASKPTETPVPPAEAVEPPASVPSEAEPSEAEALGPDTWTLAAVDVHAKGSAIAPVIGVRTGTHEGFDRIVMEFKGDQVPGYRVGYLDRPARDCTAGADLDLEGGGLLQIQLQLAAAHDEAGAPTTPKEAKPGLPVVREVERSCDFEGVVAYVVGVAAPTAFRVFELQEPARLVVDVKR